MHYLKKKLFFRYFGKSCYDFLIEVSSPEEVLNLKPDLNLLSTIETRGFIITASYDGK